MTHQPLIKVFVLMSIVVLIESVPNNEQLEGEEKLEGLNGLRVYINKTGGSIRSYRQQNSTQVKIFFANVAEADASGIRVAGTSRGTGDIGYACGLATKNLQPNTTLQSIEADCYTCNGTLGPATDTRMVLTVCVAKSNGTLDLDGQQMTLTTAQLIVGVQLTKWTWSADGQFLDISASRQSGGMTVATNKVSGPPPVQFNIGGTPPLATATFPTKVRTDNNWETMPDGYPQVSGTDNILTFRFPRFNSSVLYEYAVLEILDPKQDSPTNGGPKGPGSPSFCCPCMIGLGLIVAMATWFFPNF